MTPDGNAEGRPTEAGSADGSTLSPFESLAASYDDTFTRTRIGAAMRRAVWRRLDATFAAPARVLELGCGTGEDAVHLAARGVRVLATDPAAAMVAETRAKAAREGVTDLVATRLLDAASLGPTDLGGPFDGAFSNFGALNCVPDLGAVSEGLARHVRPGGRVLFCLLGRYVPWEWAWFLARGDRRRAFRRLAADGAEWRGLRVSYPPLRALRRLFAPRFRFRGARAIGAFVPPSYVEPWAEGHARLLSALDALERRLEAVPPFPSLADHVLLELERL
ncbi:MAG: class I SAM-dependent methyltransferase [Thermoanaerobaculia bacterium]